MTNFLLCFSIKNKNKEGDMKKIFIIIVLFLIIGISGCAHHGPGSSIGTLGGAGAGAIAGAIVGGERGAWTGAGIGSVIGYIFGTQYDMSSEKEAHHSSSLFSRTPSNNPGVESAYHRGRSEYLRAKQREMEKKARNRGKSGW